MKKLRGIVIWLIPVLLLCVCGYDLWRAERIRKASSDFMEEVDVAGYLLSGVIHGIAFLVAFVIATAFSVYMKRKELEKKQNEE